MEPADLKQILKQQALALLARREHASKELIQKLQRKIPEDAVAGNEILHSIIDELRDAGYQSDERYADMVLRSRVDRGYGEQRIRQELKQFHIDSELIRNRIDEHCVDWFELAKSQREKRFGLESVEDDPKLKAKQMRYLYGRGFNTDQVAYAMSPPDDI